MMMFPEGHFEMVVCYGVTLSYTYTRYQEALNELTRVLHPEWLLFLSVCSLYGTLRLLGPLDAHTFLAQANDHIDWEAVLRHEGVVYTRPDSPEFHQPLVMFSSEGLRACLTQARFEINMMASSNPILQAGNKIPRITDSEQASSTLTDLEVALYTCPGLVDTGEHLIAVARKL